MQPSSLSSTSSRVCRACFINLSTHRVFFFCLTILSPINLVAAQTPSTSTSPSSSSATSTIVPGSNGYAYIGCYNETTNLSGTSSGTRALYGGDNEVIPGDMTVERCLRFCKQGMGGKGYRFAGVEYSRECWCASQLSSLSAKVADTDCDLPCDGDTSQICGGDLKISVYDMNSVVSSVAAAAAAAAAAADERFVMGLLVAGLAVMQVPLW